MEVTFRRNSNVLIPNAEILSKKASDATLRQPNRSFIAFSDNIDIVN